MRRAAAPIWLSLLLLSITSSPSPLAAQDSVDARVAAIAELARLACDEWLGAGVRTAPLLPRGRRFDPRGAMSVESNVAYQIARERFAHVASADRVIADGIAWYLQSRLVEQAFDRAFLRPGYRFQTTCFFGCTVRWPLPLIVGRRSDGVGRPEYLRSLGSRRWPTVDHRLPAGVGIEAVRFALLFASLEHELGWPALQGALRAVASANDGRRVIDIIEAATARRLAAAFALASGSAPIDYAVRTVASASRSCGASPCVATRVTFERSGDLPYALPLDLEFADGSTVSTYWDGAGAIEFESAAPVSTVSLDRRRVWLLDANFTNNDHEATRATNVAVTKWVVRWMVWLQDAMLSYSFPI